VSCWFGLFLPLLIFVFGFTIAESGRPSTRFSSCCSRLQNFLFLFVLLASRAWVFGRRLGGVSHTQGHLPLAADCFSSLFPSVVQRPALCSSRVAFEFPAHALFCSIKLPLGQVLISICLAAADSRKDFELALRSACVHSTIFFGCFECPT
jgi:hypothetical protein